MFLIIIRDSLSSQLEQKRDRVTNHNDRIQQLKSKVQEHREQKLRIQQQLAETTRLKEQRNSLQSDVDSLAMQIKVRCPLHFV